MIVVDTHILRWWSTGQNKLSKKAKAAIDEALTNKSIYVSTVSTYELAWLCKTERITLDRPFDKWFELLSSIPGLEFISPNNEIMLKASSFPDSVPSDPMDRIIIATALTLGHPLVTADKLIIKSKVVPVIF